LSGAGRNDKILFSPNIERKGSSHGEVEERRLTRKGVSPTGR
jgi:hypothetical protein